MRYYIIAGEASGDLHASNLMKGLYKQDPAAEIRFRGGDMMLSVFRQMQSSRNGGLAVHYREGAVMGMSEVLLKAGKFIRAVRECEKDILEWKPDALILVDYPGFNLRIARFAHGRVPKVFWYIAPKTWASREGRNRLLRRYVDNLFIVFPFEIPYFKKAGIPFIYRGNPLVDSVDSSPAMQQSRHEFLAAHSLADKPYIAILAGSRKGEIARMMPVCMETVRLLSEKPGFGGYEFVIAGAPARCEDDYLPLIAGRTNVRVVFGDTYGVLRHAEAAIINSGTASLEAALIGTPQVVCWSTSRFNAFVARKILHVLDRIKFISLGNLSLDRLAFRELIQEEFTPEAVCNEVSRLVLDEDYRAQMLSSYSEIRENLGGRGASGAVAGEMVRLLSPAPKN